MDISKLILHPARLRIIQYITINDHATVTELISALKDIPRATVYHHVKILEENNLIKVVSENRVRGTVEKRYSIKSTPFTKGFQDAPSLSAAFFTDLMQEFSRYLTKDQVNYKEDQVFFTSAILCLTDEEFYELTKKLADLLRPYANVPCTDHKRIRKLSLISSPPQEGSAEG